MSIRDTLPKGVTLLCVSKYHTAEQIMQAYQAGERDFAESRAQELTAKATALPNDINWHFIGHLQTNKIKDILPITSLIHSVDSMHLLQKISHHAATVGKNIGVLLQVHIAREEHKFGFLPQQLLEIVANTPQNNPYILPNVTVRGLMGMATNTDDTTIIEKEFSALKQLFEALKPAFGTQNFNTLSMGMTDDYQIALRHGTTLVRIGSAIFGLRN